jgi:hypothetical protein
MKPEYPLPVRYVLYTHYSEGNDWKDYDSRNISPHKLDGVQYLVKHLSNLSGLLTWPGYEGLLVLFYAPGLHECLTGIAEHKPIEELQKTCKKLKFAKAVDDYLKDLMKQRYKDLLPRLRFITAIDLHGIFGRITNSEIADRLKAWIVGDTEGMRYDSPKIVEAIVRLRLLGSGVPVFRVDHDVLFRGEENWNKKNLEFSSTIGSCLTAYQLRRDSPNLSSFIFSASYDHKVLRDTEASSDFHAWGRAYATRVFPALPVDQRMIDSTLETIRKNEKKAKKTLKGRVLEKKQREIEADAWDCYATKSFNPAIARKFFGFNGPDFVASDLAGIGQIGAHPMSSVISGAMLYLSDGAILDLPPFSNFSLNVSWIDDHLKYCLHRELHHLRRPRIKHGINDGRSNKLLAYSKIDGVVMQKSGRKLQDDLRKYIFDAYLPTLLRGAILDAWITPEPLLKYRLEELAQKTDRDKLSKMLNRRQPGGLLPTALQRALETCKFIPDATFKARLKESALKRMREVRKQWGELRDKGVETFASAWAKGRAQEYCPDFLLNYPGIVLDPKVPIDADLTHVPLLPLIMENLNDLIKDATNYINWTRDWPTIVQVVRSFEQGTLRTDLNYDA